MTGLSLAARFPNASKQFLAANAGLLLPEAKPVMEIPITHRPSTKSPLAEKFESMWTVLNGPPYEVEVRVCEDRKWRWDYFWPGTPNVVCELQGGIYLTGKGGHVAPKRFVNDCEKLNKAATMGTVVFKLATGMIAPDHLLPILAFLRGRE